LNDDDETAELLDTADELLTGIEEELTGCTEELEIGFDEELGG